MKTKNNEIIINNNNNMASENDQFSNVDLSTF